MEKYLSYIFYIWKNVYHRDFIQFFVRMELCETLWPEVFHIWQLYDKKFWSTRVILFKGNLELNFDGSHRPPSIGG